VFFMKINHNNSFCGWASGYGYSPTLRRMLSLGRLDRAVAAGAEVEVIWGGFSNEPTCPIRAQVVELPFIRRAREAVLK
jgi:glycine cleavage system aminomethyltransferase T